MKYKLNKEALNLAMLSNGYSISKLSSASGVGKSTISKALRDKSLARPETLYKIAKALDINVLDLIINK